MYLESPDEGRPQAVHLSNVSSRLFVSMSDTQRSLSADFTTRVVGAGTAKLVIFHKIAYDTSANDLDITCQ